MKKKKAFALLGLAVLLVVLGIVYLLLGKGNATDEENADNRPEQNTSVTSVINTSDGLTLKEVTVHRNNIPDGLGVFEPYDLGDSVLRVYLKGDSYFIEGYEDMPLGSNMGGYIDGMYRLTASSELKEHDELSVYGLDSPKLSLEAVYSDDSAITMNVGNATPDGLGYYVNTSVSDSVYVVTGTFMAPYFYGLNDLLDKSLTEINQDEITMVSVDDTQNDEKDLLITYNTADSAVQGNELTPLIMQSPIKGLAVYPYNLQTTVLAGQKELKLVDIVDIRPTDLGKYGLDKPAYEIKFMDTENIISLEIGNEVDDTFTYCKLPYSDTVYTIFTGGIDPAINYNIYEFVERFVNLKYRRNLDKLVISGLSIPEYTLSFGEDKVNQEGIDNRVAIFNGKEYERTEISDFYQLVAGITFERIDENAQIQGEPELTIDFYMLDGTESIDKYYSYDSNYYIVEKDGENTGFIVSKTYISRMLSMAAEMAAEE